MIRAVNVCGFAEGEKEMLNFFFFFEAAFETFETLLRYQSFYQTTLHTNHDCYLYLHPPAGRNLCRPEGIVTQGTTRLNPYSLNQTEKSFLLPGGMTFVF
jgi:hypothetical protein